MYILAGLISVIVLIVIYIAYRSFNSLKKLIHKIYVYKNRINEIYYFTSKNYQMLTHMEQKSAPTSYRFDYSWCKNNTVICHALGELDNVLFTECKEAFEKHYSEGCRVFELDFGRTSDNVPVVIHDWNRFNNIAKKHGQNSDRSNKAMTYAEFSQAKILGKYTGLTMDRFVTLADKYKDAYFIISAKSVNQQYDDDTNIIFSELFRITNKINPDIWKRYILHAYSFDFLRNAMENFTFVSAIYRCVHYPHPLILADEMKKHGLLAVTLLNTVYDSEQLKILHDNGISIIACVVTKNSNDNRIKYWNKCNADMFMTPLGGKINEKI